jgi:hypothetical protein
MSDQHTTNNFYVSGHHNVVNFHQEITAESGEALAMVLKFCLTLLLAPIAIPFLLAANGYRMLADREVKRGGS